MHADGRDADRRVCERLGMQSWGDRCIVRAVDEALSGVVYPLPLPPLPMWSAAASLLVLGRAAASVPLPLVLIASCCGRVSASRGIDSLDVAMVPLDAGAGGAGEVEAAVRAAIPQSMSRVFCCRPVDLSGLSSVLTASLVFVRRWR